MPNRLQISKLAGPKRTAKPPPPPKKAVKASTPRRPRRVLVFGAHKVGTRSMFATFEGIEGVKPGRTHSHSDFFTRELAPGDVVLVGIRDPKKLKLSAYFHAMGSRHHQDVPLAELTPEGLFEHYCGFDCAGSGMPIDLDTYMDALLKRFNIDFRKEDWGKPAAPFLHRVDRRVGVHVVVYQLEKMSQATLDAICAAAKLPRAKMARVNVASEKDYAALYTAVKALDAGRVEPDVPEWYPAIFGRAA